MRMPVGKLDAEYTILRAEPNQLLELRGECRFFSVIDVISITPTESGCEIDYQATFEFKGAVNAIAGIVVGGVFLIPAIALWRARHRFDQRAASAATS